MQDFKTQSKSAEIEARRAASHLQALQQMSVIAASVTSSETQSAYPVSSYPSTVESIGRPLDTARGACDCLPVPGTVVRCIAPYGVAIRAGPEFTAKSAGFIRSGDTVCIAEVQGSNWIREMDGWIPLVDPRGNVLFEIEVYAC
jgi:hypothetical protein